jgi:Dna[CI] antecedent DciA-like protein
VSGRPGGRRSGRARRAGDALGDLLGRHGVARELREHRILARWRDVVGETLAERTYPDGLERGVLWVRVKNSSWLHQLSFLRDDMVARIARELGDPPLVREVRFHIGPRERIADDDALAPTVRTRRAPARFREPPPPADGERLARIEREAGAVHDPDLRETILEIRRRWDL